MFKLSKFHSAMPVLSLLLIWGFSLSCERSTDRPEIVLPEMDLASEPIIPKPGRVVPDQNGFGLDLHSGIFTQEPEGDFAKVGAFLSSKITEKTGLKIPLNPGGSDNIYRGIYLKHTDTLEGEAYNLLIKPDSILLVSGSAEGAFRGVQTLRQLIPESANDTLAEHLVWPVPGGKISDLPQFAYRGAMLDVARHFFSVEDVKKYMEVLAYYKINILHLHLTDDQGWRIEIKSWPKLTEVGSKTEVGGGPGGYYTQEEYKELVDFAGERFITIVPEVDMPGHTNAASVSYPFLNGNGKTPEIYTGTAVGFSTLDTRKDTVYSFIDDVIREISSLSPGPYFHIGGDESHATQTADYKYFIKRVVPMVRKYGKIPVGWDEVATVQLESDVVAQFWSEEDNALKAVEQGMKILMSPAKKAYLDMKYDTLSRYGLNWAAYIPVDSAYIWSPITYAKGVPTENILGLEAPLWSETISDMAELEYLAFPRLLGYAELGWSKPSNRSWEEYRKRLAGQTPYFRLMDIQFYPSHRVPWQEPDSLMPWQASGEN